MPSPAMPIIQQYFSNDGSRKSKQRSPNEPPKYLSCVLIHQNTFTATWTPGKPGADCRRPNASETSPCAPSPELRQEVSVNLLGPHWRTFTVKVKHTEVERFLA